MQHHDKIRVETVRYCVYPATWDDLVKRIGVKRSTRTLQLLQIHRYLWTDELCRLFRVIGLPSVADAVSSVFLVGDSRGTVADLVGMAWVMEIESRDDAVKRLLRTPEYVEKDELALWRRNLKLPEHGEVAAAIETRGSIPDEITAIFRQHAAKMVPLPGPKLPTLERRPRPASAGDGSDWVNKLLVWQREAARAKWYDETLKETVDRDTWVWDFSNPHLPRLVRKMPR